MPLTATRPVGLFALMRAAVSVQTFVETKLDDLGLSIPKLAALQRLHDAGGVLPLGQLADRLSCVKSNATQLVDRLEADGFVAREPDASDKRCRRAVLTERGRAAREAGARIQLEAEQQLFAGLSDEERQRLGEIIDKLKHHTRTCC